MQTRMTESGPARANTRAPRDRDIHRALLRAMRGALRRSVVLLPVDDDDDRLVQQLGSALGFGV
jgi:hypothetical protein